MIENKKRMHKLIKECIYLGIILNILFFNFTLFIFR